MTGSLPMSRRSAIAAVALTANLGGVRAAQALPVPPRQGQTLSPPPRSGKVDVQGLGVYYEIHGAVSDRPPLLLLHGGAMTIETAFPPGFITRFSRDRWLIAIEQQGHGHTADRPDTPIDLVRMVDDTAAVLDALNIERADVMGHSLGGMIGTGLAIRRPDRVAGLTVVSAPFALHGFRAEIQALQSDPGYTPPEAFLPLLPSASLFASWRESFERNAPDPTAFDAVLERLNLMLSNWPGWTEQQVATISAPTLIVVGDDDYVRVDHALAFARLIRDARLAVLPGVTHMASLDHQDWLETMMAARTI